MVSHSLLRGHESLPVPEVNCTAVPEMLITFFGKG